MINKYYKNMTFCPFYEDCLIGNDCGRKLTEKVKKEAIKWWGSDEAPIQLYIEIPNCFEGESKLL